MSPDRDVVARWGPVVAWAVVIFIASTGWFTGPRTEAVVVPLLAWLFPHADRYTLEAMHAVVRKLGHFTEYLIFGVLIARALRDERGGLVRHAVMAVVLATSYAVTDELHQHFVPGRTAAAMDVAIDALGATVGQMALLLRPRRRAHPPAP